MAKLTPKERAAYARHILDADDADDEAPDSGAGDDGQADDADADEFTYKGRRYRAVPDDAPDGAPGKQKTDDTDDVDAPRPKRRFLT